VPHRQCTIVLVPGHDFYCEFKAAVARKTGTGGPDDDRAARNAVCVRTVVAAVSRVLQSRDATETQTLDAQALDEAADNTAINYLDQAVIENRVCGFHLQPPRLIDRSEDVWQALWRCSLAEFFGTAIFVFLGTGAVYAAGEFLHDETGNIDSFIILVALAHGFAITVSIYTIGDVSGGNINPAVTWALVLTRKMSFVRGLIYWVSQLGGAIVASLILRSFIPQSTLEGPIPLEDLLGVHTLNPKLTPLQGFWLEIVLTFIFIFVVFGTAISPFVGKMAPVSGDEYGPGKLTPLALGLTILTLHCVGIPFTGASMNPARSLGPALVANYFDNQWIYWAGPLVGSTIAALVAHTLFLSNPGEIAKSWGVLRGRQDVPVVAKRNNDHDNNYDHVGDEVEMDN